MVEPNEWQGGCQCGAVRFSIRSKPVVVYACHCTDCQKQASSAFGLSAWFSRSDFEIVQGSPSIWQTTSESGNSKNCVFCKDCGSRLYHFFDQNDGNGNNAPVYSVKGGALDNARNLVPVAHIWTRSAQHWIKGQLSEPQFETEADDYEALIQLYSSR